MALPESNPNGPNASVDHVQHKPMHFRGSFDPGAVIGVVLLMSAAAVVVVMLLGGDFAARQTLTSCEEKFAIPPGSGPDGITVVERTCRGLGADSLWFVVAMMGAGLVLLIRRSVITGAARVRRIALDVAGQHIEVEQDPVVDVTSAAALRQQTQRAARITPPPSTQGVAVTSTQSGQHQDDAVNRATS